MNNTNHINIYETSYPFQSDNVFGVSPTPIILEVKKKNAFLPL